MEPFHIPLQDITATQNSRRHIHQELQSNPIQERNITPAEYNTSLHEPELFSSPIKQRTEPENPNSRTSMPNLSQSTNYAAQPQTTLRINNPNGTYVTPIATQRQSSQPPLTNERTRSLTQPIEQIQPTRTPKATSH